MDLNYLKKLTKIISESGVDEIEIEEEGLKIRIAKHTQNSIVHVAPPQQIFQPVPYPSVETVPPIKPKEIQVEPTPPPTPIPAVEKILHEVKSPIVGTFYRAPAPEADPYVEVGQSIQKGTVLCIIEAMKLMNEIESDASGRIVKILVENAQPVEYGQVLFLVEP